MLEQDRKLIEIMERFAVTYERDGFGAATPALMRRAAARIAELSARKSLLASMTRPEIARLTPTPSDRSVM